MQYKTDVVLKSTGMTLCTGRFFGESSKCIWVDAHRSISPSIYLLFCNSNVCSLNQTFRTLIFHVWKERTEAAQTPPPTSALHTIRYLYLLWGNFRSLFQLIFFLLPVYLQFWACQHHVLGLSIARCHTSQKSFGEDYYQRNYSWLTSSILAICVCWLHIHVLLLTARIFFMKRNYPKHFQCPH